MLVVWKLDRLGRNLAHLVNTVQDLSARAALGLRVPGCQPESGAADGDLSDGDDVVVTVRRSKSDPTGGRAEALSRPPGRTVITWSYYARLRAHTMSADR